MIELRKILGDDARNPRFIQSVPKAGYRIIATVEEGASIEVPADDAPTYLQEVEAPENPAKPISFGAAPVARVASPPESRAAREPHPRALRAPSQRYSTALSAA